MIKTAIALTAALLATAAPAVASAKAEPAPAPAPAQQSDTPQVNAKQRYCVVDKITGSIIERRVCHTREEWLNNGFDPLAK